MKKREIKVNQSPDPKFIEGFVKAWDESDQFVSDKDYNDPKNRRFWEVPEEGERGSDNEKESD